SSVPACRLLPAPCLPGSPRTLRDAPTAIRLLVAAPALLRRFVPSAFRLALHVFLQRGRLPGIEPQAELGAAPQHVCGRARPFPVDQIAHLRLVEVGAEAAAEIVRRRRICQYGARARAVKPQQTAGVDGREKREIAPQP